jgi:hypothetical protein
MDLQICDPGVVIDGCVDEVISDAAGSDLFAAPVSAPTTAVRDSTEFLHIDVDQ